MSEPSPQPQSQSQSSPSFARVVGSVLASFFGVQSSRRREEDFTRGKPLHYIVVGLIATFLFVLSVWGLVQWVVSTTTP